MNDIIPAVYGAHGHPNLLGLLSHIPNTFSNLNFAKIWIVTVIYSNARRATVCHCTRS